MPNNVPVYSRCDDLCIVTAYFNPCGYLSRWENYRIFAEQMRISGLKLVTIECVFGGAFFTLPTGPDVIQVRGKDVLWQKERLLNIAIRRLPAHVKKVVWADCDILFSNSAWAVETSRLLDEYPVVQPFAEIVRLGPDRSITPDAPLSDESFGAVWQRDKGAIHRGWHRHGHTGYAWASQRQIVEKQGLYDAHLGGMGDHLMAHAMCGDWESGCVTGSFATSLRERVQRNDAISQTIRRLAKKAPNSMKNWLHKRSIVPANDRWRQHYVDWAKECHSLVQARLGCTRGTVFHLWHGEPDNRKYVMMNALFVKHQFDPLQDLRTGPEGCWEWASAKTELHAGVTKYFLARDEDAV